MNLRSPVEQRDGVPWCQPGDATALWLIRDMLVREEDGDLIVAGTCPRAWLRQGQKLGVTNLPTHFGTVTYAVESRVAHGSIRATFRFAFREPPRRILLRLRHPAGALPVAVLVNGRALTPDATEWITLTPVARTLEARYATRPPASRLRCWP